MNTQANQTAFPLQYSTAYNSGLTKRELFAAMAMNSLVSGLSTDDLRTDINGTWSDSGKPYSRYDITAMWIPRTAVHFADCLIAALNEEKP